MVAGGDRPSAGYAVGRSVGPAVVRNLVRRRLRAAFAELAPAPGTYLVAADESARRLPYGQLRQDLAAALRSLGAIESQPSNAGEDR